MDENPDTRVPVTYDRCEHVAGPTRHPLRVVGEEADWEGHGPEAVAEMLESLARLREQGRDVIED